MGCVVTWVTWVRGLGESVGAWVAWVKFLRGLRELHGSKYFLRGYHFTWVIIFTWVAWVQQFMLGSIFENESKKNLDWRFHNDILVTH